MDSLLVCSVLESYRICSGSSEWSNRDRPDKINANANGIIPNRITVSSAILISFGY